MLNLRKVDKLVNKISSYAIMLWIYFFVLYISISLSKEIIQILNNRSNLYRSEVSNGIDIVLTISLLIMALSKIKVSSLCISKRADEGEEIINVLLNRSFMWELSKYFFIMFPITFISQIVLYLLC
jgi:hypothetical protein